MKISAQISSHILCSKMLFFSATARYREILNSVQEFAKIKYLMLLMFSAYLNNLLKFNYCIKLFSSTKSTDV